MSAVSLAADRPLPANYKWIVLSNTTIGMLLATINASILSIALPDIFRGIHINPLAAGNWAYLKLVDLSERRPAKIDWLGNVTLAVGLISLMIGITYGIQPYGDHTMSWTGPKVLAEIIGGIVLLAIFCVIETRVACASWLRGGKYHHREESEFEAGAVAAKAGRSASVGAGRPGAVTQR